MTARLIWFLIMMGVWRVPQMKAQSSQPVLVDIAGTSEVPAGTRFPGHGIPIQRCSRYSI